MKNFKSGAPNKKNPSGDSFLEAFRDLGSNTSSTIKDDLFKKGAQDIFNSLSPFPNVPSSSESSKGDFEPSARESDLENRYRQQVSNLEVIHREEKVLFTREQRETQNQVSSLQQEIQKLAKSTAELASEAKQAEISAMQEAPLVGAYHVNFFTKLRKLIASLREQIHESSIWLNSWNKKAQKRNHYWNQFKKSGSKFLLSSDRYTATQAG